MTEREGNLDGRGGTTTPPCTATPSRHAASTPTLEEEEEVEEEEAGEEKKKEVSEPYTHESGGVPSVLSVAAVRQISFPKGHGDPFLFNLWSATAVEASHPLRLRPQRSGCCSDGLNHESERGNEEEGVGVRRGREGEESEMDTGRWRRSARTSVADGEGGLEVLSLDEFHQFTLHVHNQARRLGHLRGGGRRRRGRRGRQLGFLIE